MSVVIVNVIVRSRTLGKGRMQSVSWQGADKL